VWLKAGMVFQNVELGNAVEQMHVLVMALRGAHTSDKVTENENIDLLNLPPDMVMHFKNKTMLKNPWHGAIIIYPGNAGGWGGDSHNDEMTLRYDGVPRDACTDFVMKGSEQMRNFGLIAVYISPVLAQGKEICFSQDPYCQTTVASLDKDQIHALCQARNVMTVMFTFASH
jgi:hypothetical protein